jgi:hypothetical protein
MLTMRAVAFWVAKDGNRTSEYEDAFALSESQLRVAVSDGASSSFMAQDWAMVLSEHFVLEPPRANDVEAVESWLGDCAKRFDSIPIDNNDTWYVHEAANRGAFATLLGLRVSKLDGTWVALAVGDTCVFHLREGALLGAFPLDDPEAFGTTPELVSSMQRDDTRGAKAVQAATGTCRAGDVFLVASDAFAQWSLRSGREDHDTWATLATMRNSTFGELVGHLRNADLIDNDDITLARCVIGETRGD